MRRTAKILAAVAVLAALGLGLGHVAARMVPLVSAGSPGPDGFAAVSLGTTQRDFGRVVQGDVLREEFAIKNAGTRRLVVQRNTGGCCGQPVETQAIMVAPGESATLPVEWDTAAMAGDAQHVVQFTTNDPKLPSFSLTLRADVQPPHDEPGS